jgi:YVTN family beta-propeller protein
MMKGLSMSFVRARNATAALWLGALAALGLLAAAPAVVAAASYQVYVTNERSGDMTIIDGGDFHVIATIPVGKRPRGIHPSPDGKTVYVALSGSPIEGPPQLDAQGNPVLNKNKPSDDDDDEHAKADKSADGVGVVDVAQRKLTGKIKVGSDPEEFALSGDGLRLYVSNEDVKAASVLRIATAQVEHIIPVGGEPEGVATSPDGKRFYVTCETGGDIFVIDTEHYATTTHFKVVGRPRSLAFQPGTSIAFIPSESAGQVNVVDTTTESVLKVITLPPPSRPMKVKVAANGSKVYVSTGRAGTVSVLDGHSYALLDTIKVGGRPWGIDLSPDGRYLFSANGPTNDVSVVDLSSDQVIKRVPAGTGPWGLTVVTPTR